jgi:hypothetical protein
MDSKSVVETYAAKDNISNTEITWPSPSESIAVKTACRSRKGRS